MKKNDADSCLRNRRILHVLSHCLAPSLTKNMALSTPTRLGPSGHGQEKARAVLQKNIMAV